RQMRVRLGARGSALSRAQAERVAASLAPAVAVEIVIVRTTGDRLSASGQPIGWKGHFTRELDQALLEGRIDLAVHSLKDGPSAIPAGLVLAGVPRREDPCDVLLSRERVRFADLPRGARMGTASPRRRAQLLAARPDLEVVEARGNVDTRIARLHEGRWDAIVLARAGLARLGRLSGIVEGFPDRGLLPAVRQAAPASGTREADRDTRRAVEGVDHEESHAEVLAERGLLAGLEAGCRAPVAARARVAAGNLTLTGAVFATDGSRMLRGQAEGPLGDADVDAAEIGLGLAGRLLQPRAPALTQQT